MTKIWRSGTFRPVGGNVSGHNRFKNDLSVSTKDGRIRRPHGGTVPLLSSLPPQRGITEVMVAWAGAAEPARACPLPHLRRPRSSSVRRPISLVGGGRHSLWVGDPCPQPQSPGRAGLATCLCSIRTPAVLSFHPGVCNKHRRNADLAATGHKQI